MCKYTHQNRKSKQTRQEKKRAQKSGREVNDRNVERRKAKENYKNNYNGTDFAKTNTKKIEKTTR